MKLFVIGCGTSSVESLQSEASELQPIPSFRKASLNMKLAYLSARTAMKEAGLDEKERESAGFILGSSYGEVSQTKEFLKSWSNEGLARPLLFQSSLHNGTLGFLSLEFGIRGPSFTVSHHYFTGEKSLELAIDLVRDGEIDLCVVSAVEVMDQDLLPSLQIKLPTGVHWRDGSASLVLATESWLLKNRRNSAIELMGVDYRDSKATFSGSYYDSDGLEKFILNTRVAGVGIHQFQIRKRDGQESIIQWRKK